MPDREGHQKPSAVPEQFAEREHRHHPGQPDLDRIHRVDEGAADQCADPALAEVVQIGAGAPDDMRLHPGPEMNQRERHRCQHRGERQRHLQPAQPGQDCDDHALSGSSSPDASW